jgi:hypothetical protein
MLRGRGMKDVPTKMQVAQEAKAWGGCRKADAHTQLL